MHSGNEEWLADLRKQYPQCFGADAHVLEVGALDINGSIRSFFKDVAEYVGVDMTPGPGVDIVADASTDISQWLPRGFNVGVCFSVFEHTPRGFAVLRNMVESMSPPAHIFLCWGAEGNQRHDPEPWAIVPHAEVYRWVELINAHYRAARYDARIVTVLDGFFEGHRYDNCPGAYDMVLRVV